ncbi:MAG: serine/threonine-protein kinase, partial [Deltaproteobacteria bacterium]|nr:serine/threonine-protein kinase [Deltaproteobacteria bacterium]
MDSRFQIIRTLGSGGQAKVFLAKDRTKGREVVLKSTPCSHDAESILREFHLLSKLSHPHLLPVLDCGISADKAHLFWTTEYLPGKTLDAVKSLTFKEKTDYLVQALRALQFLHRQGLLHADIKPSNLFLTDQGNLKLLDFGLSRLKSDSAESGGTPAYASPEQIIGWAVDARSDLYSLGITFYEIFTGRHPFKAKNASEMVTHHLQTVPKNPSQISRFLFPAWDRIFSKLTAKDKKKRFQSAPEVIEAINRIANPPYALEMDEGWKGYAATQKISEIGEEMKLTLEAIKRLSKAPGDSPKIISLKNFPPEGMKIFLDQLYFALKGERKEAFLIASGEDWMTETIQALGKTVSAEREENEACFWQEMKQLTGPVFFLFESDVPSLKHPFFFIGPMAGGQVEVSWNPQTKSEFVPLPLAEFTLEQTSLLEMLALADGGLDLEKLSRSASLKPEQTMALLFP